MDEAPGDWGRWPDDGDTVGTASARLLALGIGGRDRLAALGFLGLLLDHADADGRVRADPVAMAGEFLVGRTEAATYLDWLAQADVVVRDGPFLRLRGAAGRDAVGLREGAALAMLGEILGASPRHEHEEERVADRVAAVTRPPADAHPSRPALAAVALAVGLAVAATGLLARPERPAGTADLAVGAAVTTTPDRGPVGPSAPGTGPAGSAGRTATTVARHAAPDGDPAATGGTASELACPAARPAVRGIETTLAAPGTEVAGAALPAAAWQVRVDGRVDGGGADVTVERLAVVVTLDGGESAELEALARPVTIPAGGAHEWHVAVDAGPLPPGDVAVSATLGGWRWADAELAAACPAA